MWRLLLGLIAVLGVAVLTFVLQFVVPGDVAHALAPRARSQAVLDQISRQLHLDDPLYVQFGDYFARLLRGDLGTSYVQREPVTSLIAARLSATGVLALAGVAVEIVLGGALGVVAGLRKPVDRLVSVLNMVLYSIPTFVLGLLLLLWLGFKLNLLPVTGGLGWKELILPALTLGLGGVPWYAEIVRDQMADSLSSPYVRTAIAKGLSDGWIIRHHVLRNVFSPVLTMVGLDLGTYLSGVVVVETVFGWPGLGQLAVQSLDQLDRPVVMGTALVGAAALVLLNIVVDVIRMYVDPRTRDEVAA
jgi:ABC-type dipeptide/oligopeptide/nickel transport system permease component